jgi:hypothetical protein
MPSTSILCWFSALFYMVANGMLIAQIVFRRNGTWNRDEYTLLNPENVELSWVERWDNRALFYASGFLNAFFWTIFCIPIIEMAWILSRSGTQGIGWNVAIAIFAMGGALTEWISHLFWIGATVGSFTLALDFNLDDWLRPDVASSLGVSEDDGTGWRVLETDHVVVSGMIWIVDSFEWLCLGGVFSLTFVSVYLWRNQEQTSFSPRWNALGLFIALLAIIEFALEIVRFAGYQFATPIVLLYSALNRLILIPAWIISLGFQLPKASAYHFSSHVPTYLGTPPELDLTEEDAKKEPQFTIDDDDDVQNNNGLQSPSASSAAPVPAGPTSPPSEAFAAFPSFPPGMTES